MEKRRHVIKMFVLVVQVINFGPGTVSESRLTIYWPSAVNGGPGDGKHLLYLMQAPVVCTFSYW